MSSSCTSGGWDKKIKLSWKTPSNGHYKTFLLERKTFKVEGSDFWEISASKEQKTRLKHGVPLSRVLGTKVLIFLNDFSIFSLENNFLFLYLKHIIYLLLAPCTIVNYTKSITTQKNQTEYFIR